MFAHSKPVTCLSFHYDLIISASSDTEIKIWRPDKERKKLNLLPWFVCFKTLSDCDSWISALWSSAEDLAGDQGEIIFATMKGTFYVYKTIGELRDRKSIVDVKLISKGKLREKGVTCVKILSGSNMMMSCGFDNMVKFSDSNGRNVFSKFQRDERICGIDWNEENEEVITVTEASKVDIYQYRTGETIFSFMCDRDPSCLTFKAGFVFISGRNDVQAFKLERNIPHKEHRDHSDAVIGVHVDQLNNQMGEFFQQVQTIRFVFGMQQNSICNVLIISNFNREMEGRKSRLFFFWRMTMPVQGTTVVMLQFGMLIEVSNCFISKCTTILFVKW